MIIKLFSVFLKEWRLLWRDKVGLIFLFILPMCLVLFITLTSSADSNKPRQFKLLLINQDANEQASQEVVKALKKIDSFVITDTTNDKVIEIDQAKKKVADGDYQALIIIPKGMSKSINDQIQANIQPGAKNSTASPPIEILFDPALPISFRDQMQAGVKTLIYALESNLWRQVVNQLARKPKPPLSANDPAMVDVKADYVTDGNGNDAPNDVQQNVPAWTLFGMFFIITPLSGIIVKERRLGVLDRLSLAPVSLFSLIWGKIGAFVAVNMLQLILMLAVGVFVLPWFNLPTLNVTSQPLPIFVIGLCAAMAATGFGMLIGSIVKTPEQANVIGPFIIVIMAAIGGIFVPVYLLPDALKQITNYSPMYWALQSFIDIFVRNANLTQLWPNILKLLIFALLSICLASWILGRARR